MFNRKKVEELEEKVKNQKIAIADLKKRIEEQNKVIREQTYTINKNVDDNSKLVYWIVNILKEFGTSEVKEEHITIPVCKKIYTRPVYEGLDYQGFIERERIDIPAITIIKMG